MHDKNGAKQTHGPLHVALRTDFYLNLSASPVSNNFLSNFHLDSQVITPQSLNSYYRRDSALGVSPSP